MFTELPATIAIILAADQAPDAIFTALMPALCEALSCDRCFLYLRNPTTGAGQITHCWGNSPRWADLTGASWIEAADVAEKDPLMAIAFRTPEAVFVEDIEVAGADTVNLAYERAEFGHRALIHAPLYQKGQLYGILEPCVFETPRVWTETDRHLIAAIQPKLSELAIAYVRSTEI
jgi:GAF domain-containing protein